MFYGWLIIRVREEDTYYGDNNNIIIIIIIIIFEIIFKFFSKGKKIKNYCDPIKNNFILTLLSIIFQPNFLIK